MEKILSTKERIRILKAVIFKLKPVNVNMVAAELKLSKGLISKYFDVLVKAGVAKRVNGKYAIMDSALSKGLKVLLNVQSIDTGLFKKYGFIKAAGLFGSCARGENNEGSDMDLWIKTGKASEEELASVTAEINKKIDKANPLFLTEAKLVKMKKEDEHFYHSLVFGSILLYGVKDALQL